MLKKNIFLCTLFYRFIFSSHALESTVCSRDHSPNEALWNLALNFSTKSWATTVENEFAQSASLHNNNHAHGEFSLSTLYQSVGPKILVSYDLKSFLFSSGLLFSPTFSIENINAEFSDENELLYNFNSGHFDYSNTFLIDWMFWNQQKMRLTAEIENEAVYTLDSGDHLINQTNLGFISTFKSLSMGIFYAPITLPNYFHGIQGSLTYEF